MIYDEVVNEYDFDPDSVPDSWSWVPWELNPDDGPGMVDNMGGEG